VKHILAAGIYLFSLLPIRLLYVLSDISYVFTYYLSGYRKAVVQHNLRRAFPEKTDAERKEIERRFYRFFNDLLVECIKMGSISADEVNRRMHLVNPEELLGHCRNGSPVILVTAHYGNWELAIHSLSLLSPFPELIIYKPLSNKTFEGIYNKIRSRFGAMMVPMQQTLRKITEYRREAHISVFVADQTPGGHHNHHYIPFLNQQTPVFTGIEKIAGKSNFPVVYCHIDRIKRGRYACTFHTLTTDPASLPHFELTRMHSAHLENIIIQKPELWLWSHRRWKHSPQL